jgi:16S rRNA (cytosine967-C5)-methyltransferase
MALALDHIGAQLSTSGKLNLKMKERALLRTAIYQYCFMNKVPLYAIVNETIELAKKYCHKTFIAYLNALLRKLGENRYTLPDGNKPKDLSVRYSYPLYFVDALISDYGKEAAEDLLGQGNNPPKTMVRVRPGVDLSLDAFKFLKPNNKMGLPIAIIDKAISLSALAELPEVYIQNATPVALIASLAEQGTQPATILDLCASPGGKLLAAHDLYPKARLFANDVSPEKILRLSQNLRKYNVQADLTCGPGEAYESKEPFDLIILDVPCSNTGVLNKRPEARWRLTPEAIKDLGKTQMALLTHAASLLSQDGAIWYLTCSILKHENEELLSRFVRLHGLNIKYYRTVLPNGEGWDGGFCALLKRGC